jgi:hypothetical protein
MVDSRVTESVVNGLGMYIVTNDLISTSSSPRSPLYKSVLTLPAGPSKHSKSNDLQPTETPKEQKTEKQARWEVLEARAAIEQALLDDLQRKRALIARQLSEMDGLVGVAREKFNQSRLNSGKAQKNHKHTYYRNQM